jgi:hypothetical protein
MHHRGAEVADETGKTQSPQGGSQERTGETAGLQFFTLDGGAVASVRRGTCDR